MNWFRQLFGVHPSSAQIAKDRLKIVLSYDRTNITEDLLERLKDEIVNVISEHIEIDRGGIKITTEHGDTGEHLIADIPIRARRGSMDGEPEAEPEPVSAPAPGVPRARKRDYPASRKRKKK